MKDNIIFDETYNNKYNKEHKINIFNDKIFNNS